MLKIVVVSSSNGGAFKAFYRLAGLNSNDVIIITDRPCGIEQFAIENSIEHKRIESSNNEEFSQNAKSYIDDNGGADAVFLFYTRLITAHLFTHYLTINFHPSLLPAFRGFSPTKKAIEFGVKYFGTTAHLINENADDGQIICQACYPITKGQNVEDLEKVSFIQKVYQMFLITEMLLEGAASFESGMLNMSSEWPVSLAFNPSLKSKETIEMLVALDRENKSGVFNLIH